MLPKYYETLEAQYRSDFPEIEDLFFLKKFKAISRYLFEDFENPELVQQFFRSQELPHMKEIIAQLTE